MSNAKVTPNLRTQNNPAARAQPAEKAIPSWNDCSTVRATNGTKPISPQGKVAPGLPSLRLSRVIAFVEENLSLDLCVSTLAAVAGMSPYYFCRSFKQSTGITPHRYVLQRRMEQAKRLLEQSPGHLAEVAYLVGFADQSQFTRVFHKIVGMTPSEYRRESGDPRHAGTGRA